MKTLIFAAMILAAAIQVQAQPMGPSPEASFAGVWRIIDARPAPWAKPHALSKEEAPLLEFAIAFRDGEVQGTAPIACGHAEYGTLMVPLKELFRGGVPEGKTEEAAKTFGLTPPCVSTLRVQCDGGTFDYHFDDSGQLLFMSNNVIYTMQRPRTQDLEPGFSGPSFDCTKAHTAGEKLICRDEELSKADRTMAAAYARLSKTETPESFDTVKAAQRAWLAYTTKSCNSSGPLPQDLGDKNKIQGCLGDAYGDRSQRLEGVKVVESDALRIEPRMHFFSRHRPETEESDCYPFMAGGPQAAAFNNYIAGKLALARHRMDDKQLFAFGTDIPEDMKLYARRTYTVIRLDSKVASLQVLTYDYTGGAHEAINEFSINWDVARGKAINLEDVFAKDKNWLSSVVTYCMKDLARQMESEGSHLSRKAVEEVVRRGGNWLFDKDKAIVHFTVYTVASFAGGEFDVEIPIEILKPMMKPDNPLL